MSIWRVSHRLNRVIVKIEAKDDPLVEGGMGSEVEKYVDMI
jgi:hypothetical protein